VLPRQLTVMALGLAVLVLGALIARNGTVPGWEESVFHAVNDLPQWLYRVVWPFQQLGALVVGPVLAIICLVLRRYRLAIAVLIATIAKLLSERVVKAVVTRERPGTSIGPDINVRGDVSVAGESFVSGHAILVAALAGVVSPYLPARWRPVPWVLVALVMFGRVYVGAHNPLDVVCGAALGVSLAAGINLALGAPSVRQPPSTAHAADPSTPARRHWTD
jgi:undecaprenyl-diphosphatase